MSDNGPESSPVLDVQGTLDRFGGDTILFAEMADLLLEDLPSLFDELRAAVRSKDAIGVRERAHALKGLVAGCGGERATRVAQSLESAGQSEDLSQAPNLIESLAVELQALIRALRDFRQ